MYCDNCGLHESECSCWCDECGLLDIDCICQPKREKKIKFKKIPLCIRCLKPRLLYKKVDNTGPRYEHKICWRCYIKEKISKIIKRKL